ncbi:uncharacterized protein N0V89_009540 [Didymosphaeria variabile]|uniref:Uncharacterized protein n=1 Tax=Didymosphaeria variabile TaxID=1932322 RepID=A0A9W8XDJ9_9PLEO|nr:uncharacterized protein N0V89_009540 [Didymosphaeria variabile]KAJ4348168.1 hypothetical protein N0V89_009540 [Didymosphaeria variabile]
MEDHPLAPHPDLTFGNALQDAGPGSPAQPAKNISVIQFKNLDFSRLRPALFRSTDWFRVKRLYLHECTDLKVLFYHILISSSRIGIQEIIMENRTQTEQYTPSHPHNINHFLGDWDELLAISISTCVKWLLPTDMLSNYSNITSVHYEVGPHDVNMHWLDMLVQYKPHLVKLHISCHDTTNCLMGIDTEFEDASTKAGFPDQTIQEIRFAKKVLPSTEHASNDNVVQSIFSCDVPRIDKADKEFRDAEKKNLAIHASEAMEMFQD